MRKTCLLIHRWLSIPFGIFITIMCFTGAMLIWKNDIAGLMGCNAREIPFFRVVTQLHRWLMIAPEHPHGGMSAGRFIMGVSAIACTLILLSGIVVWWPKSKKALKKRLAVHTGKGFRRFVYDSHVSLGIYAVVFILLMSLTGPVWSFGWYRNAASAAIGMKTNNKTAVGDKRSESKTAEGRFNDNRHAETPARGNDTKAGKADSKHGKKKKLPLR